MQAAAVETEFSHFARYFEVHEEFKLEYHDQVTRAPRSASGEVRDYAERHEVKAGRNNRTSSATPHLWTYLTIFKI